MSGLGELVGVYRGDTGPPCAVDGVGRGIAGVELRMAREDRDFDECCGLSSANDRMKREGEESMMYDSLD